MVGPAPARPARTEPATTQRSRAVMEKAAAPTTGPETVRPDAVADADLAGRTLGDFHLLRRLGVGGMGQVYLAEQLSLKRKVALKLLKPGLADNATALARFKAEAEAVAR